MLPTIQGEIVRRILLNYRADAALVAKLLPDTFELDLHDGFAVVGICVIELAQMRPAGLPGWTGLSSTNAAHRVAVRFRDDSGWREGVFIWRRDTNSCLTSMFGGRAFPGVQGHAQVDISQCENQLTISVRTASHDGDVTYAGQIGSALKASTLFPSLNAASEFFKRGDCGYSCALSGQTLEGMRLNAEHWNMRPLSTEKVESAFYDDRTIFPAGSIQFDCGLMMTQVPHRWEAIATLPNAKRAASSDQRSKISMK